MFIEERHAEILNMLNKNGRIVLSDIQERFSVSSDSARRDLRILESKGLLKRTHGGAIPIPKVGIKPTYSTVRDIGEGTKEDQAIARRAVKMIRDGDTVFLTSATLGFLMAQYLPSTIKITVVTNSIILADILREYEYITTYIVGGKMRKTGAAVDDIAISFVKNLRYDLYFTTGSGLSAEFGLSNGTPETAAFQKAIIENSLKTVCIIKSDRIGVNGFIHCVNASKLSCVITGGEADEECLNTIAEQGPEIITVT